MDRKGVSTPVNLPPHVYPTSTSPKEATSDVWVYEPSRETLSRLTFDGTVGFITWSPEGKRVVYTASTVEGSRFLWKAADGSGSEEILVKSDGPLYPGAISPDGHTYIYSQSSAKTGRDIFYESLDDLKPHAFLQTRFNETSARFSPDGRYIA